MKTISWRNLNGLVVEAKVKQHIGYNDMCAIAIAMRDGVFSQGGYRPYMQDITFWHNVILHYTDIQFENVDELMANVRHNPAFNKVLDEIDEQELDWIRDQAQQMIDYERNKTGMDRLGALLVGILARSVKADDGNANDAVDTPVIEPDEK